jgi:hypothetical protein
MTRRRSGAEAEARSTSAASAGSAPAAADSAAACGYAAAARVGDKLSCELPELAVEAHDLGARRGGQVDAVALELAPQH